MMSSHSLGVNPKVGPMYFSTFTTPKDVQSKGVGPQDFSLNQGQLKEVSNLETIQNRATEKKLP